MPALAMPARMAAPAILAGMASAGIALGHRLDPTLRDPGQSAAWLRFRGSEEPAGVVGATVPPFAAVDQQGRPVTEAEFHGSPWIADFIYTRCQGLCPLLTARLVALQRSLSDKGLRFVSFSVDPENDVPEVLQRYAVRWHGDTHRWRLLAVDRATLSRLVTAFAGQPTTGAPDTGVPLHSDRFTLVDAEGRIRGSYGSTDARELARLQADAALLRAAESR